MIGKYVARAVEGESLHRGHERTLHNRPSVTGEVQMPLFELERVTLTRAGALVLQDVSATIPPGASCVAGRLVLV